MRKRLIGRILSYVRRHKVKAVFSLIFAAVYVFLTLAVPVLAGKFIDALPDGFEGAIPTLVFIALCAVFAALAQWLMSHLNNRISAGVLRDLRSDALKKTEKLPFSYLDRTPTGDTVSRVLTDADAFADGLLMGFTQLFTGVLTIVGTIVFMFRMNWRVALAVVVLTPLSVIVSRLIAGGTYKYFVRRAGVQAELTSYVDETVAGRNTVRAFGREEACLSVFAEKNERLRKLTGRAIFLSSLTNPTTRFLNALVYAAAALIGALLCLGDLRSGGMTVGMLTAFLAYANR